MALHNGGMILIVLWDGVIARKHVFLQQAGRLTLLPTRIILKLCNAFYTVKFFIYGPIAVQLAQTEFTTVSYHVV
jgi:hypothetical protein